MRTIEELMQIAEDTRKCFKFLKHTGTWTWYNKQEIEYPDFDYYNEFPSFMSALEDATSPYTSSDDDQSEGKNIYKIAAQELRSFEFEVRADSLKHAIKKVKEDPYTYVGTLQGEYIDDSFEINIECTNELNRGSNE